MLQFLGGMVGWRNELIEAITTWDSTSPVVRAIRANPSKCLRNNEEQLPEFRNLHLHRTRWPLLFHAVASGCDFETIKLLANKTQTPAVFDHTHGTETSVPKGSDVGRVANVVTIFHVLALCHGVMMSRKNWISKSLRILNLLLDNVDLRKQLLQSTTGLEAWPTRVLSCCCLAGNWHLAKALMVHKTVGGATRSNIVDERPSRLNLDPSGWYLCHLLGIALLDAPRHTLAGKTLPPEFAATVDQQKYQGFERHCDVAGFKFGTSSSTCHRTNSSACMLFCPSTLVLTVTCETLAAYVGMRRT